MNDSHAHKLGEGRIGIDHLVYHLPPINHTVREYLTRQPVEFTRERMETIWKEGWFSSDYLYDFFCHQFSDPHGIFDAPRTEEADRFTEWHGIERIYCANEESSSDMAVEAGRRVLEREAGLARNIKAIIHYHSTLNESPFDSIPCRLQHELGLTRAFAFAISQKGANSLLTALKIAVDMITSEKELDVVLLVGSDKLIQPYRRVFGKMTAAGDGAGAMIVRRSNPKYRLIDIQIRDFPERWNPYQYDAKQVGALLEFLSEQTVILLDDVMARLKLKWSDVALVIPPNISLHFIRLLSLKTGISRDKIYYRNISRFGYLMATDLAINLACASEEMTIPPNSIIVMIGAGLGFSIGCAVMQT
jgi:3-oxoacyl-[acyl-carrier-protein] synthase-3